MAHNNLTQLNKLCQTIDSPFVDIVIHLDKKYGDFKKSEVTNGIVNSKVYFSERIDVRWGGYSQILCEQNLFLKAKENGESYEYYHLISGDTMLLKTVEEIIMHCGKCFPKQFVDFDDEIVNPLFLNRIKYYYPTDKLTDRKLATFLCEKVIPFFSKLFGVDRSRENICYQKGSNWVSITDDAVRHLLKSETMELTRKIFEKGFLVDELYVQTILKTKKSFEFSCYLWEIDWTRGKPYQFQKNDVEQLKNSDKFFVRKVSTELFDEYWNRK